MSGKALLEHFSALEDPRQSWKVVYPLPEILLLVLCATLTAAEDFVEVRRWGEEKLDLLRTMLPFAHGIPSHDTLNDVLNALDPGPFSACFSARVEALREAEPDNGPRLAEDVRPFFADPGPTHETTDLDHGCGESRRHVVCHDSDWLTSDRRYPASPASRPSAALPARTASKHAEKPPPGTTTISEPSSLKQPEPLQAIALGSRHGTRMTLSNQGFHRDSRGR